MAEPHVTNIHDWVKENDKLFQPPVCNKLMHSEGQLKVFFVGGPNIRKDYHIEEGEEFFYMKTGDMCLKVVEKGLHREVPIKQGQVFLLPARVPHSPQRQADTVGLVIERIREPNEMDGLRYFVESNGEKTMDILYEKWFHCEDLGPQLSAIIKEYFQTEQYKTGKVVPGTVSDNPPVAIDTQVKLMEPFSLQDWLNDNKSKIHAQGKLSLFGGGGQFEIDVHGQGEHTDKHSSCEVFIWQLEGSSRVTIDDSNKLHLLSEGDSLLIPAGRGYTSKRKEGSLCMTIVQAMR